MAGASSALLLKFGTDFSGAQKSIGDLAANVVRNMSTIGSAASIAAKVMQTDVGQAAQDVSAKLNAVSNAASTLVRGFIAFEVAKVIVKSLIATIDEMAEHVVDLTKIADKASLSGVGTTFLQAWLGQAKALRIEVSELERMLTNARTAAEVHIGEGKYADGEARSSTSAFSQRLEQHAAAGNIGSADVTAFNSADGMEAKIRVVLDLMTKLDAEGKKLAEYDLAGKMFGPQFEAQLRQGTDMVGKMRDALNGVQRGLADRIIPPEEIARGKELNEKLTAAKSLMAEGLAPIMNDIARSSLEVYGDWVDIVSKLADAAKWAGELYQHIKGISGEVDRRISNGLKAIGLTPGTILGNVMVGMGLVQPDDAGTGDGEAHPLTVRRRRPDASRNLPNLHERSRGTTSADAKTALDSYIDSLTKSVAVAQAELDTLGKSNIEKARAVDLVRAEEAARRDYDAGKRESAALTEEERQKVLGLADAEGRLADAREKTQRALNDMKAMQGYFADTATSSIEKLIVGHEKLRDVLRDVIKDMEKMALKSVLTGGGFGQSGGGGLFGGLFGLLTKAGDGKTDDLFGWLAKFGGMFADGGTIPAGQFGLVGERGPEFISGPATITPIKIGAGAMPSAAAPARAGDYKPTIYATFHMDGVTSRDEVQGWVQAGMAQAHAMALRDMPGALAEKQNRSW